MQATVLIADHDPRIADATRRCLVSHGCDAASATNGLQCLEQMLKIEPTVVVLDPDLLWGGGEGVLDWLIHEDSQLQPMVVVADGPGSCHISDQMEPWVDLQIQRPGSLQDLPRFVNQLEAVAKWSVLPYREPSMHMHTSQGATP